MIRYDFCVDDPSKKQHSESDASLIRQTQKPASMQMSSHLLVYRMLHLRIMLQFQVSRLSLAHLKQDRTEHIRATL